MALMANDLQTATGLADGLGINATDAQETAELWPDASAVFGPEASHSEIHRHLAVLSGIP
ncbi:hypothetical protein [Aestuariivirga sp.]|uniref:hypothetical protein n=1 Tax=Aestuariivirga sp. TaxID=2650926 RepID=UPI003593B252